MFIAESKINKGLYLQSEKDVTDIKDQAFKFKTEKGLKDFLLNLTFRDPAFNLNDWEIICIK